MKGIMVGMQVEVSRIVASLPSMRRRPRISVRISRPVHGRKGWVKLTGEVDWRFEHDAAAKDVRSLYGVIGVTNDVTIKPRVNTKDLSGTPANRCWRASAGRRSRRRAPILATGCGRKHRPR
ncbi:BON domain-containing protein [Phenylobacterium sp.]|uniref:BON domain-containing protein n=1 Tax=Phenylobacterium sp. TaxID=1871053 RepID=UPI001219ACBA|nr:MAG: BON domain-containing protein [Phenylobacterium sp.]